MATRNELIEYLKTLPEDVEISVMCTDKWGDTNEEPLNLSENGNIDYADLTNNEFVGKDSPRYNKKYLLFGY